MALSNEISTPFLSLMAEIAKTSVESNNATDNKTAKSFFMFLMSFLSIYRETGNRRPDRQLPISNILLFNYEILSMTIQLRYLYFYIAFSKQI